MLTLSWHALAERMIDSHRLLMLVGEPGVGKTVFSRSRARKKTGQPAEFLQGTPETELSHVWGLYVLQGGETAFVDGPLPRALKRDRFLIVEEFNLIPLEVRATLLPLREMEQVTNPLTGEEIPVPDAFRLVATSNPESLQCRRNMKVAQALLDDFLILEVPDLGPEEIRQLLSHHFPDVSAERLGYVVEQWEEFQNVAADAGESATPLRLSYRAAAHLLRLLEEGVDEKNAIRVALINKYIMDEELYQAALMNFSLATDEGEDWM